MTETHVEVEAALLEGLAEMPADLIPLRNEFLANKEAADALKARQDEIKSTFADKLVEEGLQGFLLHGKVHARRSEVTNTRIDSNALKEKLPHIWQQFVKTTKSVRVTVN